MTIGVRATGTQAHTPERCLATHPRLLLAPQPCPDSPQSTRQSECSSCSKVTLAPAPTHTLRILPWLPVAPGVQGRCPGAAFPAPHPAHLQALAHAVPSAQKLLPSLLYLDNPSAISVDSSSSRKPSSTPPVWERSPVPRVLKALCFPIRAFGQLQPGTRLSLSHWMGSSLGMGLCLTWVPSA